MKGPEDRIRIDSYDSLNSCGELRTVLGKFQHIKTLCVDYVGDLKFLEDVASKIGAKKIQMSLQKKCTKEYLETAQKMGWFLY